MSLYESQLQWGERGEGGGAGSSDFDRGLAFVKGGEGEGQVSAGRAGGGGHVGEGEREEGGVQRRVSSIKLLAYSYKRTNTEWRMRVAGVGSILSGFGRGLLAGVLKPTAGMRERERERERGFRV